MNFFRKQIFFVAVNPKWGKKNWPQMKKRHFSNCLVSRIINIVCCFLLNNYNPFNVSATNFSFFLVTFFFNAHVELIVKRK